MHTANNLQVAFAPVPGVRPLFDSAEWLARYTELGGSYSMVGDSIWLHWLISADIDEMALRAHERVLRGRPDWRDAVKALILERVSREVVE